MTPILGALGSRRLSENAESGWYRRRQLTAIETRHRIPNIPVSFQSRRIPDLLSRGSASCMCQPAVLVRRTIVEGLGHRTEVDARPVSASISEITVSYRSMRRALPISEPAFQTGTKPPGK